jgi:hypothetical protein
VRLALELGRVNEPVEVDPPADAKPASAIPRG